MNYSLLEERQHLDIIARLKFTSTTSGATTSPNITQQECIRELKRVTLLDRKKSALYRIKPMCQKHRL